MNIDPETRSVWTSTDGLTWQRLPGELTNAFSATGLGTTPIHWKDNYLTITGGCGEANESAAVWESMDLVAWRRVGSLPRLGLPCVNPVGDIVTLGGRLVVAAMLARGPTESASYDTRPVVWSSSDGHTWSAQPLLPWSRTGAGGDVSLFAARGAIYLIHYRNQHGGAVAWRSTDAVTWTMLTTNLHDFLPHNVVPGGKGVVALLDGISTSADGRTWRTVRAGLSADDTLTGLLAAGPTLVAVGWDASGSTDDAVRPVAWISGDGLGWQRAATLPPIQTTNNGIVWYRGHLIWFPADRAYVSPPVPGEEIASVP